MTRIGSPRLLRLLGLGQTITIPQRPSEEEAEVGNRSEEMKEEKGGLGVIYRKAQQPS